MLTLFYTLLKNKRLPLDYHLLPKSICGCVLTARPQQRVYFLGSWSNTNIIIGIGFSNEIQKCYFSIFFGMIIYFLVIFSQLGFLEDMVI